MLTAPSSSTAAISYPQIARNVRIDCRARVCSATTRRRQPIPAVTATPAWFAELCDNRADLYVEGVLDLHEAVDECHGYAKLSGLNRRIGRDTVQHIMAVAFGAPSIVPDIVVRRWELADPRDRWKWTGEAPPPAEIGAKPATPRPRQPAQSTIDAFWLVVRQGDADRLRQWLARHPADAATLRKIASNKNGRA